MKRSLEILKAIRIDEACPMDWDRMAGNDQVRHCPVCDLDVHDLSRMTADQAAALVAERRERLCVRFLRRDDGIVATRDRSELPAEGRRSLLRRIAALAASAFGLAALGGCGDDSKGRAQGGAVRLQAERRDANPAERPHEAIAPPAAEPFRHGRNLQLMGKMAPLDDRGALPPA